MAGRSSVECHYCGTRVGLDNSTFDHVVPLAKGGADDLSNGVLACRRCNAAKGRKSYHEFLRTAA
jgi:5-methylcytosine-specific restriction endonuclease McrA